MGSATQQGQFGLMQRQGLNQLRTISSGFSSAGGTAAQNRDDHLEQIQQSMQDEVQAAKQVGDIHAADQAMYKARVEIFQTELEYAKQVAEIRKQQLQESNQFGASLVGAGIQGGRAPANFIRQWGLGQVQKMGGNLFQSLFGTIQVQAIARRYRDSRHARASQHPGADDPRDIDRLRRKQSTG